jgi:hypothetical protein
VDAPDPRVDELVRLTGWSGSVDAESAWRVAEAELGLRVPTDFKQLTSRFPSGMFSAFFELFSPVPLPNGRSPFVVEFTEMLRLMSGWDVPYPVYPAEGGLVPWGRTVEGHTLCWLPTTADPDGWQVVLLSDDFAETEVYQGTATAFLLDALTGRFTHEFFEEALAGEPVYFGPDDPS